jgi:uncharacterized metal-binding protein YceD (DUF177 family)
MDKNSKTEAWNVPVAVADIPDAGLALEIEAPAEARAALAVRAGLRDLSALSAAFELSRRGAGVHVSGRVRARVGQTCVVTLEPGENEIDETVDLVFAPEGGAESGEDDPPEPLADGTVDLGAVASESLILGIDPYPRKPNVEFVPPEGEAEGEHPFAALAALKNRLGGGQA